MKGSEYRNQKIPSIKTFPDSASLASAATDYFVELAIGAMAERDHFSVALAGGSTPKAVYTLLVSVRLDWERVHMFWGDERCVPPDHPDSNYRMARQVLLDHIPIPPGNVHRMRGEVPPAQAAEEYELELQAFFMPTGGISLPRVTGNQPPAASQRRPFDLIILGMGEDGHTASLFPGSPALEVTDRWVAAVEHRQPPLPAVDRISLTLPAINAASRVVFLVTGENKAGRLKQALSAPGDGPALPVQRVRPATGNLLWMVDQAAAVEIIPF